MRLHPASPALDYALYLKGLVNFNDELGLFGSLAQQDQREPGGEDRVGQRQVRDATLAGPPVRISQPEYPWEKVRFAVNEGPAVLIRHDRVWVTYSAAGTGRVAMIQG